VKSLIYYSYLEALPQLMRFLSTGAVICWLQAY